MSTDPLSHDGLASAIARYAETQNVNELQDLARALMAVEDWSAVDLAHLLADLISLATDHDRAHGPISRAAWELSTIAACINWEPADDDHTPAYSQFVPEPSCKPCGNPAFFLVNLAHQIERTQAQIKAYHPATPGGTMQRGLPPEIKDQLPPCSCETVLTTNCELHGFSSEGYILNGVLIK
jgi:hypothetical protein